jgi:hypothetical protein
MVGQTPQPSKVVARKMRKDELLLSRQRFLVVVEIVVGFSLLFVFGGALAVGISEPGSTVSGGFLRTALLTGGLAAAGVILFLRGLKRWWQVSQSGSSVGYKRPDELARGLRYACPGCGGDVYHGQAVCPQCGYVLADSSASNR